MRLKKNYSFRLFPRSSFISGMATIFNIAGNFYSYNYSKTPNEADSKAVWADWLAVGDDMRVSIELHKSKHNLHVGRAIRRKPATADAE